MSGALTKRVLKLERAAQANALDPTKAMTDEELDPAIETLTASLEALAEANPDDPAASE